MAGGTKTHWIQLAADGGLVFAIKGQRTGVLIYSWGCFGKILRLKFRVEGRAFFFFALLPVVPDFAGWQLMVEVLSLGTVFVY